MDFNAILNFLKDIWESLTPYYTIMGYEKGVAYRFGKFDKVVEPGPHWKIPFVDDVFNIHVTTETIQVKSQSLTTKDEKNIVIASAVKCSIGDPKTYHLKTKDVPNALADITQGKIKSVIMNKTWAECRGDIDNEITEAVKPEAKKLGIDVEFVTITDLAILKTIRLIQS